MPPVARRTINYFDVDILTVNGNSKRQVFNELVAEISRRNHNRSANRYRIQGPKSVNITGLETYMGSNDIYRGRFLGVRTDMFPELIDMDIDQLRDIEANDNEGIVEFSHFLLRWIGERLILALEYNHYGARNNDFAKYLTGVGLEFDTPRLGRVDIIPISSDLMTNYQDRLDNFSFLIARIHKDNIARINGIDAGFGDAMANVQEIGDAEYVELKLKYNTSDGRGASRRTRLLGFLNRLLGNNQNVNVFDRLVLKASDNEAATESLREFDILNVWVKTDVYPFRRERSRSIDPASIYGLIYDNLMQQFGQEA